MMSQSSLSRSWAASTLAYHCLPGGAPQLLRRPAVAGELAAMHRVAGTGQTLRDEAQLDRRPAEPVHEQHADAPAANVLAAVGDLPVGSLLSAVLRRPRLALCFAQSSAHAHPMAFVSSTAATFRSPLTRQVRASLPGKSALPPGSGKSFVVGRLPRSPNRQPAMRFQACLMNRRDSFRARHPHSLLTRCSTRSSSFRLKSISCLVICRLGASVTTFL